MPRLPRLRPRAAAPRGSELAERRGFGARARDLSPWQRREAARAQPRSPWKLRGGARPAASAAGRVSAVLKGRRPALLIGCCLSGGGAREPQRRARRSSAVQRGLGWWLLAVFPASSSAGAPSLNRAVMGALGGGSAPRRSFELDRFSDNSYLTVPQPRWN